MALLQIGDPIASATPIGIDLGTTHSLVAYVPTIGAPVALQDCNNSPLTPSVVHYKQNGAVLIGSEAYALAASHPQDTILSAKRLLGKNLDDDDVKKLGYRFVENEKRAIRLKVGDGRVVTPVEVSAEILKSLKAQAEDALGQVGGAVITVPAYFDDAQRQATKDAAKLAGLSLLRLLNEPTAAALAYGLDKNSNGTFVVYDLGGGTFDITVLDLDNGVFQVRSTGGDSQLGGDDMDYALAEALAEEAQHNFAELKPQAKREIIIAARQIKHALTSEDKLNLQLSINGVEHAYEITRARFDALIAPLLKRTGLAARRALRDAEVDTADIDGVILVGGATRVPAVRAYVEELFGQAPLADIDPDQVVALGAAYQADMLASAAPQAQALLLDVLPLSLGIETMGGVVERILTRNTPIPTKATQTFTTYADNQTGFELHVVQGERDLAQDCRSLAHFFLKGIPPMAAGMARLDVSFSIDADGLLTVSAKEQTTQIEQRVEVSPTYGLSDTEVETMLLAAYEHGENDIHERALRETRVEAQRMIQELQKALATDADLLEPSEKQTISERMNKLTQACDAKDHRKIATLLEALDISSRPFAGRRMDRNMKRALAGQAIGEIEEGTKEAQGVEAHIAKHTHG